MAAYAGWTYREMEDEDGTMLPVIEAHCEYRQPARYDDEIEIRTTGELAVAGAGEVPVRSRAPRRRHHDGRGLHRARRDRPDGPAQAAAGTSEGVVRMKALVTGVAGFIGSHAGRATRRVRGHRDGPRLFHGLLSALDQGAQPGRAEGPGGVCPRRVRDCQMPIWPRLLDGVTHVFHLAAQAGVRKSWGRDFQVYTVNNIEATQLLLEACCGAPIERLVYASSSSVYGDASPIPMREDALPQPVSPYGVTKLAAEQLCYLYHVNHGVPTVSLRYFTVYGPRQRPDMGFHRFLRAGLRQRADHALRRRRADPGLHLRRRRRRRHDRTPGSTGVPGRRVQYWRRVARLHQPRPGHHRRAARPSAGRASRAGAEGRHARHLCRHGARARASSGLPRPSRSNRASTPRCAGFLPCPSCSSPGTRRIWNRIMPARVSRLMWILPMLVALSLASGCAKKKSMIPTGMLEADKYLYERGNELMAKRSGSRPGSTSANWWTTTPRAPTGRMPSWGWATPIWGRRQPNRWCSPRTSSASSSRSTPRTRAPTCAQYKLGMCHFEQMLAPDRDQTETKEAVAELTLFVERYPNSSLMPEGAAEAARSAQPADRIRLPRGLLLLPLALVSGRDRPFQSGPARRPRVPSPRCRLLLPGRVALKMGRRAEAVPYYDRLIKEFEKSQYLVRAQQAMAAAQTDPPAGPVKKVEAPGKKK